MEHEKKLTLSELTKSRKVTDRVFRASDYLSEKELEEIHKSNAKGKKIVRPFDDVDAFGAEILARFGWDSYQAWLCGEFDMDKALRFVAAERARDKQTIVHLEALILSAMAGANNPDSHGHMPKSLRQANDIFKKEIKQAQGEQ